MRASTISPANCAATLTAHLDRMFAEAFPKLARDDRGRMLAAWSDITGAMIASLDRSRPAERVKLLEELKTILVCPSRREACRGEAHPSLRLLQGNDV